MVLDEAPYSDQRVDVETIEEVYSSVYEDEFLADNEYLKVVGGYTMSCSITTMEIQVAMKATKSRVVGPDGWSIRDVIRLSPGTVSILANSMFYLGYVPARLRENRAILIPKNRNDPIDVNNYRPITISSVFFRIVNKVWAKRLSEIKTCDEQGGFKPQDACLANTMILHNIIKNYRNRLNPHTLISLDLKKAFDRVSHHSLVRALRRFGVPQAVVEYVAANFRGIFKRISCGSQISRDITLKRDTKQGDPMSPILFNMLMDKLLSSLPRETGLDLDDIKVAALAYADDVVSLARTRKDGEDQPGSSKEGVWI